MTTEEAIKLLDHKTQKDELRKIGKGFCCVAAVNEALNMAISALRAQQTPLDRSRWEGCHYCDDQETVMELDWIYGLDHILHDYKFCPMCGRPLTEEAWAEMERRLR